MQEVILKKVIFGGYDCFDVMNHINALQIKLNRAKEKSVDTSELYGEAERLRAELREKEAEIDSLNHLIYAREYEMSRQKSSDFPVRDMDASDFNGVGDTHEKIEMLQQRIAQISGMINEMAESLSALNDAYKQDGESINPAPKETTEKKTVKKAGRKKKTTEPKANAEALELLRKSEERYKNL